MPAFMNSPKLHRSIAPGSDNDWYLISSVLNHVKMSFFSMFHINGCCTTLLKFAGRDEVLGVDGIGQWTSASIRRIKMFKF